MPKGKNLDSYKLLESMYEENSKKFRKKYKTKEPTQKEKDLFIKNQKNILNMQKQVLKKSQSKKTEYKQEFNKISQSFDLIGKPTKLTRPGYAGGGKNRRRWTKNS